VAQAQHQAAARKSAWIKRETGFSAEQISLRAPW
jgi:hypothetical protein